MRYQRHKQFRFNFDPQGEISLRLIMVMAAAFAIALLWTTPTAAASFDNIRTHSQHSSARLPIVMLTSAAFALLAASIWPRAKANGLPIDPANQFVDRFAINTIFPQTRALIANHRLPDRSRLRHLLESLHVDVVEVGNGSRAADQALNSTYDVIFLNSELPIMAGAEVRQLLRKSGVRTPIIVTCPNEEEAAIQEQQGAEFVVAGLPRLDNVRTSLSKAIPQKAIAMGQAVQSNVRTMQSAVECEDYQQLIGLVQKVQELGESVGNDAIASSATKLEACLTDALPNDEQLSTIGSTLEELMETAGQIDSVGDCVDERVLAQHDR